MNYTLKQLQIFLTVKKTQSVTKAAEEHKLTQPAISIQLKNFQEQFELPLTEVVGRKIYITDFGNEIADAAEKILQQAHEMTYIASAYKGELTGKLTINSVSSGAYLLPEMVAGFIKKNPKVEVKFEVSNKENVIVSLENNTVDFALGFLNPENLNTENLELFENKLYMVCHANSHEEMVKNKKSIFEKYTLLLREQGSGTRGLIEKFLNTNKIKPGKVMEFSSNEGKKQAILANLGFTIMPEVGIKKELISGEIKIIKYPELPLTADWQLIWLKGKNLSPVAESFLSHIKKHQSEIIEKILH